MTTPALRRRHGSAHLRCVTVTLYSVARMHTAAAPAGDDTSFSWRNACFLALPTAWIPPSSCRRVRSAHTLVTQWSLTAPTAVVQLRRPFASLVSPSSVRRRAQWLCPSHPALAQKRPQGSPRQSTSQSVSRNGTPAPPSSPSSAPTKRKGRRAFQHRRGVPPQAAAAKSSEHKPRADDAGEDRDTVRTSFSSRASTQRQAVADLSSGNAPVADASEHHTEKPLVPASTAVTPPPHHHHRQRQHNSRALPKQRASPQAGSPTDGATHSRAPQANKSADDMAPPSEQPLVQLLRTHDATRENYTTLNKDERVVKAFYQVCLDVVRETLQTLKDSTTRSEATVEANELCVFFDAPAHSTSPSTAAHTDTKAVFRVPLTTSGSALVAPLCVPVPDPGEFFELLTLARIPTDTTFNQDPLQARVHRLVETHFVEPMTSPPSAPGGLSVNNTDSECYWRFHSALETHWLTPPAAAAPASSSHRRRRETVAVDPTLATPAGREAWRRQRAHDLVQLADTVAFFKWAKDTDTLTHRCPDADAEATSAASTPDAPESFASLLSRIRAAYDALCTVDAKQRDLPETATAAVRVGLAKERLAYAQQILAHSQAIRNVIPKVDEPVDNPLSDTDTSRAHGEPGSLTSSMHVLDVLLMLLLRALLPLWPTGTLSTTDRASLFRLCTFPWFSNTRDAVCLPLARWLVLLELPSVVVAARAGSHSLTSPATKHCTSTSPAAPLEGSLPCVQLLRLLCWPTPLDTQSSIVVRALAACTSTAAVSPTKAPMKELLAVLNSTETRQRLAYDLFYLLFTASSAAAASQSTDTSVSTTLTSRLPEHVALAPHLLRSHAMYLRSVSALCVYAVDVDRFMSERVTSLPRPCALLFPSTVASPARVALSAGADATRTALLTSLTQQAVVPGALTRQVFLCFSGPDLAALWTAMTPKRGVWLWEAYVRAVGSLCLAAVRCAVSRERARGDNDEDSPATVTPEDREREGRAAAVWACLAPMRAQLCDSPKLRGRLAEFLLNSFSEATTRADEFVERGAEANSVRTSVDGREGASCVRVTATHVLHLSSVAALLLEVDSATTPATTSTGSALNATPSEWAHDVTRRFELCLRAFLRQPHAASPDDAQAIPASVEQDAEARLLNLAVTLDAVQVTKTRDQKDTPAQVTEWQNPSRRLAAVLATRVLTSDLRTDVRLWAWRRDQSERCGQLERPLCIAHPILRQWQARLRDAEVSGTGGPHAVNAARVYDALVPLLPNVEPSGEAADGRDVSREAAEHPSGATAGPALPSLTVDELQVIFSLLAHLHTRAGLHFVNAEARQGTHHRQHSASASSQAAQRTAPETVFDLMAHAVTSEAASTIVTTTGKRPVQPDLVAARVRELDDALRTLLLRAVTGESALADERQRSEAVRRVPLSLWLNAVVLGMAPLSVVQPGPWPSTVPGRTSSRDTITLALATDPQTFFSAPGASTNHSQNGEAEEEEAPPEGEGNQTIDEGASVPSTEAWLRAFQDDFRLHRSVRLAAGLVLQRHAPCLIPEDCGWHRLLSCAQGSEALDTCDTRRTHDGRSSASATPQLLHFLQHELLQCELAEAVCARWSGAGTPEGLARTSALSTPTAVLPCTFAFPEEDGMKEVSRGYARLVTLTTLSLSIPPDSPSAPTAESKISECVQFALHLRALSSLWCARSVAALASSPGTAAPALPPHTTRANRIAAEALLDLALATQRLVRTHTVATTAFTSDGDVSGERDLAGSAPAARTAADRTPRLPPSSPTRAWATRVLAGVEREDETNDPPQRPSQTALAQLLVEAVDQVKGFPTLVREKAARDSGDVSVASLTSASPTQPTNGLACIDVSVLTRAARDQVALWLPAALDGLAGVHVASASAVVSTRHVVSLIVAVAVLTEAKLVPAVVSHEFLSTAARLLLSLADDRRLAARDANLFIVAALVAPQTSMCLLSVAHHLREARDQLSLVELVRALEALTVAARTIDAQHDAQADRQAEEAVESSQMISVGTASRLSKANTPPPVNVTASPSSSPVAVAPTPLYASAATHAAEFQVSEGDASAHGAGGVCRRLASVPSGRGQPPALRTAWLALARRLLQREAALLAVDHDAKEVAASPTTPAPRAWLASAWSHALACGAALGCADSLAFEQLFATLVCGGEGTSSAPLISSLSFEDWARVVEACRHTPDIQRDELAEMLREPLLFFVQSVPSATATDEEPVRWQDVCQFLEALPMLFVEGKSFWRSIQTMTERCLATATADTAAEWRCSFNWAARSAGHDDMQFVA